MDFATSNCEDESCDAAAANDVIVVRTRNQSHRGSILNSPVNINIVGGKNAEPKPVTF